MKTEELFESGITPLDGPHAGKKLEVKSIDKDGLYAGTKEGSTTYLKHGEYKIWEPEKNLFDDPHIKPTWGNLKKAAEEKGLSDDALFAVHALGILPALEPAGFELFKGDDGKETVVVF